MAERDAPPQAVGLLGGGVIGGGWAARFLLAGSDVRLYDPAPDAQDTVAAIVERARRAWSRLTAAPLPPAGTLSLAPTVEDAVDGVDLVQESAPEREELKVSLLTEADRAAAPHVLIATSTSGLLPTRLAAGMAHPDRFIVGHPFNPVYLLPLVEVCGGQQTSPDTVSRAAALYEHVGMRPLVVRHEIDGFVADRLMEALWREALWLVADDVATVAEIDDAIRFGAGLRWASMGTFLTYRLAGGEGGMRHFMEQFGPALQLPWTRLTDVPELDDTLLDRIVTQSDDQAGGVTLDELAQLRDDCLVAVMRGLAGTGWGAGEVLTRVERRLSERAAALPPDGDGDGHGDARLRLHAAVVAPEWIDYNGHMTESRYLEVMADATDALLHRIGADGDYLQSTGSYFTVESHLRHLDEVRAGDRLTAATHVLGHDAKRLHLFHELLREPGGETVATGEHILLHVARASGRTGPADNLVLRELEQVAAAQADLERPAAAGASIRGPEL